MKNIPYLTSLLLEEFYSMKIVKNVSSITGFYPDEPQIPVYVCSLELKKKFTDGRLTFVPDGYGSASTNAIAYFKALMEGLERFSQACYKNHTLLFSSYKTLKVPAVNPVIFNKNIHNAVYGWTKALNDSTGEKVYIPAQLIYTTYKKEKEPYLLDTTTSGTAAGVDHTSTLLRAIYELIERDAFMCVYLTKSTIQKITLSSIKGKRFQDLVLYAKRYNLEPMVFNLTNDIQIPSFLTLLIDHTGIGPAFSMGLKSSLLPTEALIGSFQEALQARTGTLRSLYRQKQIIPIEPITSITQRALFWYSLPMLKHLQFLTTTIETPLKMTIFLKNEGKEKELETVRKLLRDKHITIYYADVTLKRFKKHNFYVYKAVIPELQQLHLNEKSKIYNINRLQTVANYFGNNKYSLNKIPQPFL